MFPKPRVHVKSKEPLSFFLLNSVLFSTGSAYSGSKFEIRLFFLLELSPSSSLTAKICEQE